MARNIKTTPQSAPIHPFACYFFPPIIWSILAFTHFSMASSRIFPINSSISLSTGPAVAHKQSFDQRRFSFPFCLDLPCFGAFCRLYTIRLVRTSMSKNPTNSANRGKLRQIVPGNGSQMVVRNLGSVECRGDRCTFS